jgi:hypothetical protein
MQIQKIKTSSRDHIADVSMKEKEENKYEKKKGFFLHGTLYQGSYGEKRIFLLYVRS